MDTISLSLTNVNEAIKHLNVVAFDIKETEGLPPKALIAVIQTVGVGGIREAVLKDGNDVIFSGVVEKIEQGENLTILTVTKPTTEIKIDKATIDQDIIELLYDNKNLETPEIFCKLNVPYYDRVSNTPSSVSIIKQETEPIILDQQIIKNSLRIQKINNAVSSVNLEISCSWISKAEGDIDISSKISGKFPGGRINTLTPKSLEKSWPRFGEKITGTQIARQSRYYVGHSRLSPENTMHMNASDIYTPLISIDSETSFKLKRSWYDHTLSICFDYDQPRKETIKLTLNNNRIVQGMPKNIKINLRSVQEYIENDYIISFFQTKLGRKTYKYIAQMAALYIAYSMRDTLFSFSIPYTPRIKCSDWITVRNRIAKISALRFKNNRIIEVEAIGFSDETFRKQFNSTKLQFPDIGKTEPKAISSKDIIHDIVVENDGISQTTKLLTHLKSLGHTLNKANYKQLINKFLNENKTSIKIITRPLKTRYCESNTIDLGEIMINN